MRLIGVGVGPGDPELVTIKAVARLRAAGRVFVPVLPGEEPGRAETTVRSYVEDSLIERLTFVLDPASRESYWEAAGERVAQWLRVTGGTAAFATIGDPNVYSTFSYLAATVKAIVPSVVVETIPGITAMQALSAASGVPLVEGTEPLTLLPLPHGVSGLESALKHGGAVVAYKGGRHLPDIVSCAKDHGRLGDAVIGSHLGLPDEMVGPLSEVDDAPYLSCVLIPARRDGTP